MKLYTWTTPNGFKPLILLEELGVSFELAAVNLGRGAQKSEEYTRINPNQKIPALVDEKTVVFESGAILFYLAEKFGRFLPPSYPDRGRVLSWLMFQMGGVGPMFGQANHFRDAAPDNRYARERYFSEATRLLKVMDGQLRSRPFIAGDAYTIADMALFPWTRDPTRFGQTAEERPGLFAWVERVGQRPAVKAAFERAIA
ncbi:MAG: glutathione S-transferase family protein [Myxococcota bacterium]